MDDFTDDELLAFELWPSSRTIREQQDGLLDSPCQYVVLMAGRRGGKGYALGHAAHIAVRPPYNYRRLLIAGTTASDTRDGIVDTLMSLGPANERPTYEPSLRLLTWPNGATAQVRYAAEPSTFRGVVRGGIGPDLVLIDELAAWKPVRGEHAFEVLEFTLLDASTARPKMLIATTPKPTALMRELVKREGVELRRWSTRDNAAHLDAERLATLEAQYAGTRLGRQELEGELLEDFEGAYWTREMLDEALDGDAWEHTDADRLVLAIDPAGTDKAESDYTAMVVAGKRGNLARVFACSRGKWSPGQWARRAASLYDEWGCGVAIVERNQLGDTASKLLREAGIPSVRAVHTTISKADRGMRAAGFYEQGRVSHAPGLMELEDEMAGFPVSGDNDDQVDALGYALDELLRRAAIWAVVG